MHTALKIHTGAKVLLLVRRKIELCEDCNLRHDCMLRQNLLPLYQVRKTKFGDVLENLCYHLALICSSVLHQKSPIRNYTDAELKETAFGEMAMVK